MSHPFARSRVVSIGLTVLALGAMALGIQACEDTETALVMGPGPVGPGSVTTQHNNLSRDGNYNAETRLTPANVRPETFGKVAALPVDGLVYAQPLIARGMTVPGRTGTHDLLIAVTEHDSVYAFDAESLQVSPIWRNNLVGEKLATLGAADVTQTCGSCSGSLTCSCATLKPRDTQAPNIAPEVGVTSTPVIDEKNGVLYLVAASKENGEFHIKLHALDVTTGREVGASPVEIQGSASGTGYGTANGTIIFDSITQLSRAGLVLNNGSLFIAFSSYDDVEPSHGWMFAYDAATLMQTGTFITTPDSGLGNIWMAGQAPAVDAAGNIYFATGNGDANHTLASDYDDAILKLGHDPAHGLGLMDWFTPFNRVDLANNDIDVGSGGVLLLPDQPGAHPHLLLQVGKEGTFHLLDRDHLGGMAPAGATSDTNIVQELPRVVTPKTPNSFNTGVFAGPVYWNHKIYVAPVQSTLRAFSLTNGLLSTSAVDAASEQIVLRGGGLSVSSNGDHDGIIWMIDPSAYTYGWNHTTFEVPAITNGPSVLYAYDPNDLSEPLYRSDTQGSVDNAGFAVKFSVPTIAGGHVFVGTQTEISVYGNIPTRKVTPQDPGDPLPQNLSQTGFFTNLAALTPAEGLLPYDVISPLWSDGASKNRWILLPAGGKIGFDAQAAWTFPIGTRLIKQFDLSLGNGVTTRVETRVLTLGSAGWSGGTYQWKKDQSDAVLLTDSQTSKYTITAANGSSKTQTWSFPSPTDCLSCHNTVAGGALGVRTRQLNRGFSYASGSENELAHWNGLHLFTTDIGDPAQYSSYSSLGDTAQSLDSRVRSYLAVNCAICHVPGGPAAVGIDLGYDTALAQMGLVNEAPSKGNLGVDHAFLVTPGSAYLSVLYLRMNTAGTGRMPPLASQVVDANGVAAVKDWINAMQFQAPPPGASSVRYRREPGQPGNPAEPGTSK